MSLLGITSEIVVLVSLTTCNFWPYTTNRLLKLPILLRRPKVDTKDKPPHRGSEGKGRSRT